MIIVQILYPFLYPSKIPPAQRIPFNQNCSSSAVPLHSSVGALANNAVILLLAIYSG